MNGEKKNEMDEYEEEETKGAKEGRVRSDKTTETI